MITATEAGTFVILPDRTGGYEALVRFATGGALSGHGFKDGAAARAWVAKHAPNAKEVMPD